jgi:hypothetical protein
MTFIADDRVQLFSRAVLDNCHVSEQVHGVVIRPMSKVLEVIFRTDDVEITAFVSPSMIRHIDISDVLYRAKHERV